MGNQAKTYLTTNEAAEYMGHHRNHVLYLARLHSVTKGKQGLKGFQRVTPKGSWRFYRPDIDRFMRGGSESS